MVEDRLCSKVTCKRPAHFTLTYDYDGCVMAIGPLSPVSDPHGYDLCELHAENLKAPSGWQVLRHSPFAGINEDALDA